MNNNTSPNRNFFGVLVEALRIDESRPAVNFRVLVSLNAWQKARSQTAREIDISPDRKQLTQVFNAVYDIVSASGAFVRLLKPLAAMSYYVLERTHKHVEYALVFSRDRVRAAVILNFPDPEINVHLFQLPKTRAAAIEAAFGGTVDWDLKEGRRRQTLRVSRTIDRGRLVEQSADVARWAAEKAIAFRRIVEVGLDTEVSTALAAAALQTQDSLSDVLYVGPSLSQLPGISLPTAWVADGGAEAFSRSDGALRAASPEPDAMQTRSARGVTDRRRLAARGLLHIYYTFGLELGGFG